MRARVPRCRLFSPRVLAILLLVVALGAYCYYYSASPQPYRKPGLCVLFFNTSCLNQIRKSRKKKCCGVLLVKRFQKTLDIKCSDGFCLTFKGNKRFQRKVLIF